MKPYEMLNALSLLKYDGVCFLYIIHTYLESNKSVPDEPTYGDAVGNTSFMYSMIFLDIAMISYEGLLLLSQGTPIDELTSEVPQYFFPRIKQVNEGIHHWDKEKRARIIADRKDEYAGLKNDISLAIYVPEDDGARTLLGVDLFFEHYIKSSDILMEDLTEFSRICSSYINTFADFDMVTIPDITDSILSPKSFKIEMFDRSLEDVAAGCKLSEETTYSLLILLSRLSYIELFLDKYINDSVLSGSMDWLFFLLRWLSVYYMEAFRSFRGIAENSTDDEYRSIDKLLDFCFANSLHDTNERIASSLSKMIHYSNVSFGTLIKDSMTIYKMYSYYTGIKTWAAFENQYKSLRNEINIWTKAIRNFLIPDSKLL